jgi:hypothetical protein
VYGPVRTVVWQGSAGDRRPYADLARYPEMVGHIRRTADGLCFRTCNSLLAKNTLCPFPEVVFREGMVQLRSTLPRTAG